MEKLASLIICLGLAITACTKESKNSINLTLEEDENNTQNGVDLASLAYQSYKEASFSKAVQYYESLLLLKGDLDFWQKVVLAKSYMNYGQYREALKLGNELIEIEREEAVGYEILGFCYLAQNKARLAIDAYEKALTARQYSSLSYFYLGVAHGLKNNLKLRDKSFESGEKEYQLILEKNTDDISAHLELSYLYIYWRKKLDDAKSHLEKAKSLMENIDNPDEKMAWKNFYIPALEGLLLSQSGKSEESNKKLIELFPHMVEGKANVAEVYFFIGRNYEKLGQISVARRFYSKAKEIDPITLYSREISSFFKTHK